MPEFNLGNVRESLGPAWTAARTSLPAYRREAASILFLSGLAVVLEAAGLALIYFLIRLFTFDPVGALPLAPLAWFLQSPLALTIGSVCLLTTGVQLKYWLVRQTSRVAAQAGIRAGVLALREAHALFGAEHELHHERQRRKAVSAMLKDVPFACGFAAGGFSLASIHAVQAVAMSLALLFLSPLLTIAVLALALVGFLVVTGSFETVVSVASERREALEEYRAEVAAISEQLFTRSLSLEEFAERSERALAAGSAHRQLTLRITQRREQQAGSLVIEYLYPLAILCLSLLYMEQSELAPPLSELALYFLLLRQTVSSLNALGHTLMSFSRQQHLLAIYDALVRQRRLPRALFQGGSENDDD